jgi:hypothetical protein
MVMVVMMMMASDLSVRAVLRTLQAIRKIGKRLLRAGNVARLEILADRLQQLPEFGQEV